jgi:hypothetical protein
VLSQLLALTKQHPPYLLSKLITFLHLLSCHFLSPDVSCSGRTQPLDVRMLRQVFYHCATVTGNLLYSLGNSAAKLFDGLTYSLMF